jgi:hypothetical protein
MTVKAGSIRFNTDTTRMEIYNGEAWWEIDIDHASAGRGFFMGGTPTPDRIDFISMDFGGTATDFGNLSTGRFTGGAFASQTRAVYVAGEFAPGAETNLVDYITMSSAGDAKSFGDLIGTRRYTLLAVSNKTRGITGGGGTPTRVNTLDYFTISTQGNSSDFGDLLTAVTSPFSAQSATRAIMSGGTTPSNSTAIEFFTMTSLGNATDFGDLTVARASGGGGSNSTRAVFMGGTVVPSSPNGVDTIDYVEISTTGNAIDFGNTATSKNGADGGCASPNRICQGGGNNPSAISQIDGVRPQTTGNAIDFGDLSAARTYAFGTSNSHGGVSM